jgi:hypothetical protein
MLSWDLVKAQPAIHSVREVGNGLDPMGHLATALAAFFLATPAVSVELFRFRGAARDGGTTCIHFRDENANWG